MTAPSVLVVMGVSGAGKTTLARALAVALGWPFVEGDGLHPPANIAKMAAGAPLDDADREAWLATIAAQIDAWLQGGGHGVITCSALKRAYRQRLGEGRPGARFVFVRLEPAAITERLARRHGHFMPPTLLESQFDALEPPGAGEPAITVDGRLSTAAQVEAVVAALGAAPGQGGAGETS